jgi:chromatin assembly factor 1 subunit B
MRTKTLEIRWHDTQPIFSSDSQPYPPHQLKRLLSQQQAGAFPSGKEKEKEVSAAGRSYRVATGGADNHVRVRARRAEQESLHLGATSPSLCDSTRD